MSAWSSDVCSSDLPAPTDTIAAHGVEAVAGNGDMITVKKVDRVMKVLEFGLRNADIAAVPDVNRHGTIRRISVEQAMHIHVRHIDVRRRSEERSLGTECGRPFSSRWYPVH